MANSKMQDRARATLRNNANVYTWEQINRELTLGLTGPPIQLYVVRHAQSAANARGMVTGRSDIGLSLRGYIQALTLGLRLPRAFDGAWVSSLERTRQTLQLAGVIRPGTFSHLPICADPRLDERSLGELEGTPQRQIQAYALGDLTYAPHGGESYLDLAQRLLSFLLDLRKCTQRQAKIIIATHVGPMRLLVGIIEKLSDPKAVLALRFPNAEGYIGILEDLRWPPFIAKEVLLERRGAMANTRQASINP